MANLEVEVALSGRASANIDFIAPPAVLVLAGRAQRGAARHPSGLPRAPDRSACSRRHTSVLIIRRTQKDSLRSDSFFALRLQIIPFLDSLYGESPC